MCRRLTQVVVVLVFAITVRPASAQKRGYRSSDILRDSARGYTDAQLAIEQKLLRDKSQVFTWESLPLIEFPRWVPMPEPQRAKLGDDRFRELQKDKLESAQKRFADAQLKDRTFSGAVRITRKEQNGGVYTIYAHETSRPVWPQQYTPPGFSQRWPTCLCQWQSDNGQGFKVGENADMCGKIEDLKEDGKANTLFLRSVVIAAGATKETSQ